MSHDANIDPATERVLAGVEDEGMAARYPKRAHFTSADNPHQGEMATRALFDGDPVVIVYPDGHELLVQPEQARGFARWSRAGRALARRSCFASSDSTRALCNFLLALVLRPATQAATRSPRSTAEVEEKVLR